MSFRASVASRGIAIVPLEGLVWRTVSIPRLRPAASARNDNPFPNPRADKMTSSPMTLRAGIAVIATIVACKPATDRLTRDSASGEVATAATQTQAVDWKAVDAAMGRAAVVQPGDVHRFNFPRSDMHVTAAGVEIKPSFALGGWIAMKAAAGGVVAMGDL